MNKFITIEGCEGVGKTMQTKMLKQYCEQNNLNILFTREPGGSRVAEKIRQIILDANNAEICDLCEAFLYASSRAQHLNEIIVPALNQGKTVICDRFVDSSYAYQGIARGLGLEKVRLLNSIAIGEYMPQYTIFLDLAPELAFARKGGVDKRDRIEVQNAEFHKKVYSAYHELIRQEPSRFIVINASGTREETQEKIKYALKVRGIL
ncbi:MAG: dTMP kinase [Clostridia bacterium]